MKRFSIRRRSVSLKEWLRGFLLVAALAAGGEAPAADAGKTVLVLGDSISAAYGLQTENGEPGWVQLLRQRLGSRHGVVNASISGDTTVGGLTRLPRTLAVHKPDIVIIELGGNDGLRGYPVTSIRANLLAMTEAVLVAGAKPVLAGMQMPPNLGPRYTQAFRELYTGIAAETGAALVPFLLEGIATDEALMQRDGIHPNAKASRYCWTTSGPCWNPCWRRIEGRNHHAQFRHSAFASHRHGCLPVGRVSQRRNPTPYCVGLRCANPTYLGPELRPDQSFGKRRRSHHTGVSNPTLIPLKSGCRQFRTTLCSMRATTDGTIRMALRFSAYHWRPNRRATSPSGLKHSGKVWGVTIS